MNFLFLIEPDVEVNAVTKEEMKKVFEENGVRALPVMPHTIPEGDYIINVTTNIITSSNGSHSSTTPMSHWAILFAESTLMQTAHTMAE